jgi:hypothetical protein
VACRQFEFARRDCEKPHVSGQLRAEVALPSCKEIPVPLDKRLD